MDKQRSSIYETARAYLVLGVLAASAAYYGASDPWFEFALFSSIFVLTAEPVWRGEIFRNIRAVRFLILPCLLLALFSLIQTAFHFFVTSNLVSSSSAVPFSFDAASSFRSAFKIFALVCFILNVLEVLRTKFRTFIFGLAIIGSSFAAFAIVRYLLQEIYFEGIGFVLFPRLVPGNGFGTFLNQNHFALSMLMVLALNLSLFWFGQLSVKLRTFFAAAGLISWTAIILTASRGGIVSSIVVWILFLMLAAFNSARAAEKKPSNRVKLLLKIAVSVIFVAGTLIGGIALIGQERVIQRFGEVAVEFKEVEHQQAFRRVEAWDAALDLIAERPIFGVGFGGYKYAASRFLKISGRTFPTETHNDLLAVVVSAGLIGTVLAVCIIAAFAIAVRSKLRMPLQTFGGAAFAGAICGIAGVFVHSLFDYGLQFTGNSLFFTALVSIVFYRYRETDRLSTKTQLRFFGAMALIIFALVSAAGAFVGFARKAVNHTVLSYSPPSWIFLLDPEFIDKHAVYLRSIGQFEASANARSVSVRNRPDDFQARLELAKIRNELSQIDAADKEFKAAIALAPYYGEPRFQYGTFLLDQGRTEEAVTQLADAFHKDYSKAKLLLELIWNASGQNTGKMLETIQPEEAEMPEVQRFFTKRADTQSIVQLACLPNFPDYLRSMSVHQLLEKSEFHAAWKVSQRHCDTGEMPNPGFTDGGFEAGVLIRDLGFGWRIGKSLELSQISFDEDDRTEGTQSLRIELNGKAGEVLLSGVVPVRPDTGYSLVFDHKVEGGSNGGTAAVQILFKKPGLETVENEILLSNDDGIWQKRRVDLKTFEGIEAVEVRLILKDCGGANCEEAGTIKLDNFVLSEN